MRPPASLRGALASALAVLIAGVGLLTLVAGFSSTPLVKAVQFLAVVGLGTIVIGGTIVLALVHLADWRTPEDDFETIVRRAERIAAQERWLDAEYDPGEYADAEGVDDYDDGRDDWSDEEEHLDLSDEEDFRALVRSALDDLPLELHRVLEHVAIVVTDGGRGLRAGRGRRRVYGLYQGDASSQDYFHDRVLIFRDALVRDFGDDPELLREELLRTVSRELSHHAGSGGRGIRGHQPPSR